MQSKAALLANEIHIQWLFILLQSLEKQLIIKLHVQFLFYFSIKPLNSMFDRAEHICETAFKFEMENNHLFKTFCSYSMLQP